MVYKLPTQLEAW